MKKIFVLLIIFAFNINVTGQEKELPPKGGAPKGFNLPEKEVIVLDNGLTLVMVPYGGIPKATINIMVKTGNINEKENQVWLSDLMASLLEEGSKTQSSQEIDNKIAGMGGNLNVGVRPLHTTINCSVLNSFVSEAITVMGDVLLNPMWPENELERLKKDMKRNLLVSLSRPQSQAQKNFFAEIYPDHSFGRIYPTEELIDSYSVDEIMNFYNENFGAQRTTIYVVGKFNKDTAEKAVRETFKNWKKGPEKLYPIANAVTEKKVRIIDRPGAPQSTIYYGLPTLGPSNSDYISLYVTNSILGGSFGSRITSNIREDKGYTYSPRSSMGTNYKTGVWYEIADVTTEFTGASIDEINKEIVKLQNEPPSVEELVGIKNYESGVFVLRNSSPSGIINQLHFLDVHELDDSFLTNRIQNILSVTPEQVQEMTKKYIRPESMTLIVVGDKEKINNQIEETIKVNEKLKQ